MVISAREGTLREVTVDGSARWDALGAAIVRTVGGIAAKPRGDWVLLKVRDHGMGVAVDMLPNLIKPFFRGDAARTAATGAGLGLAIVDKTVQRMGGIIALANTTSGGLAAHIKLQKPKKV